MLPEKEVKAIHGAVTVEDVKAFKDLAGVCGWDADHMSIAEAAAVGASLTGWKHTSTTRTLKTGDLNQTIWTKAPRNI